MNDEQQQKYRAYVRGAATFLLLGKKDMPVTVAELVQTFDVDTATVNADIDAIVQSERHKIDGVFEDLSLRKGLPAPSAP